MAVTRANLAVALAPALGDGLAALHVREPGPWTQQDAFLLACSAHWLHSLHFEWSVRGPVGAIPGGLREPGL